MSEASLLPQDRTPYYLFIYLFYFIYLLFKSYLSTLHLIFILNLALTIELSVPFNGVLMLLLLPQL